jgi:hypothetical protein
MLDILAYAIIHALCLRMIYIALNGYFLMRCSALFFFARNYTVQALVDLSYHLA